MKCPRCSKEMQLENDHHVCKKCGVKINVAIEPLVEKRHLMAEFLRLYN